MREVLYNLGSEHKIVVVFADTVFTVATFVPPFVLSQHSNAHPNRNLFPVVFHIPFSDLKITEIEKNEREKPEFSIRRLSLYGRPLWSNVIKKCGIGSN